MARGSWSISIAFFGFHHILMFLNVCAIVVWSILLAGCSSSNGLRNVYLISLSYKSKGTAPLTDPLQVNPSISDTFSSALSHSNSTIQQINISHMSICIQLLSDAWICGSNAQDLVNDIKGDPQSDPFNLVWVADKFQSESTFYPLYFIAIVFTFVSIFLLATFPGWTEEEDSDGSDREIKPFPSRPVSYAALALSTIAALFSFISVFWQHIASACALTLFEALTYDTVEVHVGPAAMVCGWFGFGVICITSLGLYMLIASIKILTELID
ncbi:Ca2+ regulator and membrane fusion protein Fig1-domain-containing protein [Hypoxylon trugodes]|uniref:Ca2+ regulator and membrane fusion protein Fig1-domain-containing protein n=1 Tax=Hypoxylon trugodes TaxID=326681 RepID=UPI002198E104|nr:Ca2+ regulator and membrane fusion protein Fig1-domain-containing protein [Hypoxylon trugodes]KAI1386242.1 Ca2+ regulator and membrane fusion protein Fig1-domain-containing protein [Hypoxylon trugodes]